MGYKVRLIIVLSVFLVGASVIATDAYLGFIEGQRIVLNALLLLVISLSCYYIPIFWVMINKAGDRRKRRKELRYLKKIFILCGSVKPVDSGRVLKKLISKAKLFKQELENISEVMRLSSVDKDDYFSSLLSETKDIDTKLFYEKLSIAFLYDFDMAVANIRDDFEQDKREYGRYIKKKVNLIHIIGVTGLFVVMTVLLVYMLDPWLAYLDFGGGMYG